MTYDSTQDNFLGSERLDLRSGRPELGPGRLVGSERPDLGFGRPMSGVRGLNWGLNLGPEFGA